MKQTKESKLPALPTGLVRHKNGTYYLRRRIPSDLLDPLSNKKEVHESLKTKNYLEAVKRLNLRMGRLQSQWDAQRQRMADIATLRELRGVEVLQSLSNEDIERIASHYEAQSLAGDERRREEGHYELSDIEDYKEAYRAALPLLKGVVAVGDIEPVVPALSQFLYLNGYDNQLDERDFKRLALAYARAAIRVNESLLRRYEGEEVPTPRAAARFKDSVALAKVAQDYIDKEYAGGRKLAMAKKVNLVVPMLAELVGKKPISELKQSDINYFFELVHQLWPRWSDVARATGKSWIALAKSNEDLSRGELAPGTFEDTYRAVVRRFLSWAITNYQDRGFPTSLTVKLIEYRGAREGGENRQRAFRLTELKSLFEGSDMRKFALDPAEHHRFWLPHVGLYTGARVNELCQLHPKHDIQKDPSGIWYFKITEDGEEVEDVRKSVKTGASRRLVPIHSAIRFITPEQRHRGLDTVLLAQRQAVYEAARARAPHRWSGPLRNWSRIDVVHLNPDKNSAEASSAENNLRRAA